MFEIFEIFTFFQKKNIFFNFQFLILNSNLDFNFFRFSIFFWISVTFKKKAFTYLAHRIPTDATPQTFSRAIYFTMLLLC
jgi:hypothetical protein